MPLWEKCIRVGWLGARLSFQPINYSGPTNMDGKRLVNLFLVIISATTLVLGGIAHVLGWPEHAQNADVSNRGGPG